MQRSVFEISALGQDDTVYAEHRPMPLTLIDRPPSSPSKFDLKSRMYRSSSQHQLRSPTSAVPEPSELPLSLFEVVHRAPSRNLNRLPRQNSDPANGFKSGSFQLDTKTKQSSEPPRLSRPITAPTAPVTYEVKRGGKIYKVIVGYVSPYTSPLQRTELHLKTDGEVDKVIKQIREQQEKQRASKPQIWLGLSQQSTLK